MRNHFFPVRSPRRHRWLPLFTLAASSTLLLWITGGGPSHLFAQDKAYSSAKKSVNAPVRPIPGAGSTLEPAPLAKIIDAEINLRLQQEKIPSSPRCDDTEFLRRIYLDLVGAIPGADRVKAFLENKDPNKREQLIDALLSNPRFGKQQSEIWMHEIISADPDNRFLPTEELRKWLEVAFNANKPWNKIVEELVTASGTMDNNPATMFYIANSGADKATGQVSRLFLGVQLQCAQCHNHPFTDWKQDEYWGMAAFFGKVRQDGDPKKAAKNGGTITVSESPPVLAPPPFGKGAKLPKLAKKKKAVELPEGFKNLPPKFLAGPQPKITGAARPVLARWLTSTDNRYFANAMVNRAWAQFFGRGFVNPIDDMHDANPATHPELLLALAEQFKRHNYDLKYLMKAIVLSEAYQRTSKPFQGNETDTEMFSRMYVRTMSAEQLFDSIVGVVGLPGKGDLFPKKGPPPAGKKGFGPLSPREQFVRFFRVEEGADSLTYQDGIPQALRLMNAPLVNVGGKALEEAVNQKTTAEGIKHLFVTVLSRPPSAHENERFLAYVSKQADKRTAFSDILWTLLNTSEFRLNH